MDLTAIHQDATSPKIDLSFVDTASCELNAALAVFELAIQDLETKSAGSLRALHGTMYLFEAAKARLDAGHSVALQAGRM